MAQKFYPGDCTLKLYKLSSADNWFLSELTEKPNGQYVAKFDVRHREHAIKLLEGDAHRLCAILRGQDIKCFVVWAGPNE